MKMPHIALFEFSDDPDDADVTDTRSSGCSPLAFDYDTTQDTVIWPRFATEQRKDRS